MRIILKTIIKRILLALPMLIVMIIIFGFSGADGQQSGSLSLAIAKEISNVLNKIGLEVSPTTLHLPIRKLAHMSEYALLFITAMWAFTGIAKRYLWAFMLSVLFAISDEAHQLFVPERAGSIVDVLIDTVGIIIGMSVYWVILRIKVAKQPPI